MGGLSAREFVAFRKNPFLGLAGDGTAARGDRARAGPITRPRLPAKCFDERLQGVG